MEIHGLGTILHCLLLKCHFFTVGTDVGWRFWWCCSTGQTVQSVKVFCGKPRMGLRLVNRSDLHSIHRVIQALQVQ